MANLKPATLSPTTIPIRPASVCWKELGPKPRSGGGSICVFEVTGISSLPALADEDNGGGVAGKSDVVHCFFSCSTVDDDNGGTHLADVVRSEPSGPKEYALRGEYDINSENDSASAAARLPMVALGQYNEQAVRPRGRYSQEFNSNELLHGWVTSFPNDEMMTWVREAGQDEAWAGCLHPYPYPVL